MSRALRYAPPIATRELVERPRLLATLRGRFERPLTIVVAGAGGGKTTLLMQAFRENQLSPLGDEKWLTCQRDDASLSFLVGGAFQALEVPKPVPEDPRAAAVAVAEAMWRKSPTHIGLVLDDAHEIPSGTPGEEFLVMLIEELPLNGHLVLATRPASTAARRISPAWERVIARLRVQGRVEEIDQQSLDFAHTELEEFARLRDLDDEVPVDSLTPWPAVAELRATFGVSAAGVNAVGSYLRAELLSGLSDERRRALAVLAAVGGADQELASQLLESDLDLDATLDGLPLVVRADDGWRSLHDTWKDTLRNELDAAEVADVLRKAGVVLRGRRQYHDAMNLLLEAKAWDEVLALITEVCEVCTPLVPNDVLEVWQERLPRELHQTPEALLLASMIAEPTDPAVAEKLLERALETTPLDPAVRYACLNALVQLAFWRSDRARMKWIVSQLRELAERGHPDARGWVALVSAVLALRVQDVRSKLGEPGLRDGSVHNPVQHWLHAHVLLLKLGDPGAARAPARQALKNNVMTMMAVSRSVLAETYRLEGRLDEPAAMLPALLADLKAVKVHTSPELVTQAVVLLDVLGRTDEAEGVLEDFLPAVVRSPVAWAGFAAAMATAFHAVSVGDEVQAAATVRDLTRLPVGRNEGALVQVSASALVLVYVLVPEVRPEWDGNEHPGWLRPMHALARALVDLREHGDIDRLASLDGEARRLMPATLPVPWLVQLAVGRVACGDQTGRALVEELGNRARPTLRALAAGGPLAATADELRRTMPALPAYRLRLRLLGSLELSRDGVLITHEHLRRRRVRELLGYLALRRRALRHEVAAALWPDLDMRAGAHNLSVTLGYLQKVLEPDRARDDPAYFVRTPTEELLELVDDPYLEVDTRAFEACLRDAWRLNEQGALSAALDAFAQATDLWGGDYLGDVPDGDWLDHERRTKRTQFVDAAVRAGELFLTRGDLDRAWSLGERALGFGPECEEAYQLLVAVHLERGDRLTARRYLDWCRQMLFEQGRAEDARTTTLDRKLGALSGQVGVHDLDWSGPVGGSLTAR